MAFFLLPIIAAFFAKMSVTSLISWGIMAVGLIYGATRKDKAIIGDKLLDHNIATVDYGNPKVIFYGHPRVQGQLIWKDFEPTLGFPYEYMVREGNGGHIFHWEYCANFAYALGDGVIEDVAEIWLNNELVYSIDTTKNLLNPALEFVYDSEHHSHVTPQIIIQKGDQTDVPPILTQTEKFQKFYNKSGYPITPPYKGTPIVIFKWWNITKWGNQIPTTASFTIVRKNSDFSTNPSITKSTGITAANTKLTPSTTGFGYPSFVWGSASIGFLDNTQPTQFGGFSARGDVWSQLDMGDGVFIKDGSCLILSNAQTSSDFYTWSRVSGLYNILIPTNSNTLLNQIGNNKGSIQLASGDSITGSSFAYFNNKIWKVGGSSTKTYTWDFTTFSNNANAIPAVKVGLDNNGLSVRTRPALLPLGTTLYCLGGKSVSIDTNCYKWSVDHFVSTCSDVTGISGKILDACVYGTKILALCQPISGDTTVCFIRESTDGITWIASTDFPVASYDIDGSYFSDTQYPCMGIVNGVLFVIGGTHPYIEGDETPTRIVCQYVASLTTLGGTLLSEVIADIATRVGYDSTKIITTSLVEDAEPHNPIRVPGYVLNGITDAKSALNSLQRAYSFDIVFHSGYMHCIKRGYNTPITIPSVDVGCGADYPKYKLKYQCKSSMDLPQKVIVRYPDLNKDSNTNTQSSIRNDVPSKSVVQVDMAITMTAAHAKKVSEILLYDAYNEAATITFTLPFKYSYLVPTDVVTFTDEDITYIVRIIKIVNNENILEVSGCVDDINLYVREPETETVVPPPKYAIMDQTVIMRFLDIPRIRELTKDDNDGYGFYMVASLYREDTNTIYQPIDVFRYNETSRLWDGVGTIASQSVIGESISSFGDCSTPYLVDNHNTVDVHIYNGTLSTATDEQLNRYENLALIGNEIIQFKTATLINATNYNYRLSGISRGLFGTEIYTGSHPATSLSGVYERFVLLNNVTYIKMDKELIGQECTYVWRAEYCYDSAIHKYTSNAISKRCLSPVHLSVTMQDTGAWKIEWMGRVRGLSTFFENGVLLSGELQEEYEIEFYDDAGDVKLIQTVIVLDGSLTGNQTPYFYLYPEDRYIGSDLQYGQKHIQNPVQTALKFKIYQIGSIGRGFPLSYNI